jgi:hypothetical protein
MHPKRATTTRRQPPKLNLQHRMNAPINKFCIASFRFVLGARCTLFVFVLVGFAIVAPIAFAQPDPSIFDERRYVPQQQGPPPQAERPPPPSKPLPRAVLIAGAAVLLLVSSILLFKSARAWRSSNLFDRQYRFPSTGPAALRFGGNRCGGQLATLNFHGAAKEKTLAKSDRENV